MIDFDKVLKSIEKAKQIEIEEKKKEEDIKRLIKKARRRG